MSFFEHSARVPLIISGPGVESGRSAEPVSLVDLFPTFMDVASSDVGNLDRHFEDLDGRSLLPLLTGETDTPFAGEVLGEYCAECASHPIFMIRRGNYKYIHCDADPPQLFDIENDPMELDNLATQAAHKDVSTNFAEEVLTRWDSEKIRADVLHTQRQRRAVHAAMQQGALTSWDYQPKRDAAQEFVRNHIEWTELSKKARFPPAT